MTTITIDRALLEQALDALTCSGDNDDPGHRCSHCDDYVDRNSVVRQALRAALAAQRPAPDWHDAPTTPGVWVCDEGDICYTWTAHNIEILDIEPEDEVRWYGPIPPDGDTK